MSTRSGLHSITAITECDSSQHMLKRAFDVSIALAGLLVFSPLLAAIAILIRVDSPGPALYRQTRVGRGGVPFMMYKFRTMFIGSHQTLDSQLLHDPQARLDWSQYQKLFQDPRLTRLGAFLRKSSLDEFPQLWNVLRGEMSLVGPRPILPDQRSDYGPAWRYYTQVPPGMTGLWQVSGRNQLSFSERASWDALYVRKWTLRLDGVILLRTIRVVLWGTGAF